MKYMMVTACLSVLALGACDTPDDAMSEGTYQAQTGFDPETANMSTCSDGAMREDCSFAPNGY